MKKILINDNSWQTRIAITRDGKLQNLYFSAHAQESLERAFFKGIILKVLPGIQTAFVEIGQEKAGFLHISEIDRELALSEMSKNLQLEDEEEQVERKVHQKKDISKIFHEGDEVLVQVSKEPIYEKGAKLTTCYTLPGRFIVLMPNIPRIGVSKKIAEKEERYRLKDIVRSHLPEGMGAIIRTTSEGRNEQEIIKDLNYLVRKWKTIEDAFEKAKGDHTVCKLHEDIPLPLQIVRDHLDDDVEEIITDNKQNQTNIYNFIKSIAPEYSQKIKLYTGDRSIFTHYDIEKQITQALDKKVSLKSGGSLIIETTEAMTVVDVNTGKFIGKKSMEDTILQTNIEAAEEIVRQLKLRNIGGLIVIDFIDMTVSANKQKLSRFFEKTLREQDKFQSVLLKISEFGLVQMTRKRSGKTLIQQLTDDCPTCKGSGFVPSVQTECYALLRNLQQDLTDLKDKTSVTVMVHPTLFDYISSIEYNAILELEKKYHIKITIATEPSLALNTYKIEKK
ncbi:MAG TPA: Rne/Rng family ribonuclease [Candidatus Dependentiae bacterium]|nr:Rne/Rng family ribonuclease [Candidatus Dependentiae bacterium]HRQ62967.1 Rne/Rng family ribonuclease [Candidatus Dependentiae bacterium]